MRVTTRSMLALALVPVSLVAVPARAQMDAFPSRPVTIVVPFTPGASSDLLMRMVGQKLQESWKEPVIIDNRPGGGGAVGALFVKNAPADGYTLFMAHSGTHVFNIALYGAKQFDPVKDFQTVTPLIAFPTILVVAADSPAKNVADLVAMAKSKSNGLSYASQGVGNTAHLTGEMFASKAGVPMVHVPYRGVAPALTDVMAGRVDMMFVSYLSAGPHIEGGRMRAIAINAAKRSAELPNVPTMAEQGYSGTELDTWFGIVAPAGTPAPIVAKLHDELIKAMGTPDLKKLVLPQVADIVTSSPDAFSKRISGDIARVTKIVNDAGIKADPAGMN